MEERDEDRKLWPLELFRKFGEQEVTSQEAATGQKVGLWGIRAKAREFKVLGKACL